MPKQTHESYEAGSNPARTKTISERLQLVRDFQLTPLFAGREILQRAKAEIDAVQDAGERAVLEGQFDLSAATLWRESTLLNKDSAPLGANSLPADARPSERLQAIIADLEQFPFYSMDTRAEVLAEAEKKLKFLTTGQA